MSDKESIQILAETNCFLHRRIAMLEHGITMALSQLPYGASHPDVVQTLQDAFCGNRHFRVEMGDNYMPKKKKVEKDD